MNSAFKRVQPLPHVVATPEFLGRMRTDRLDSLTGNRALDDTPLGEGDSRVIRLERVRFE